MWSFFKKKKEAGLGADTGPVIGPATEVQEAAEPIEVVEKPAKPWLKLSLPKAKAPRALNIPIRIVMGYLPDVTKRDALEYSLGIAEKHFEQIGITYYDAFKYQNGFVFEVHEGGTGKAYAPEIIKYFDSLGAFASEHENTVVIRTASRKVEIQRQREGLLAVMLPESSATPTTDWLEPTVVMQPAIDKRTGMLVAGATMFLTGFLAMLTAGALFRVQPIEPPQKPAAEQINVSNLPHSQWFRLESIPPDSYVRLLRFKNGKWEAPEIVSNAPSPAEAELLPPPPPPVNSDAPAPVVIPPATTGSSPEKPVTDGVGQ